MVLVYASVNSSCAQTPPGYCGAFAHPVSPWGRAFANFTLPGGQAFANPGANCFSFPKQNPKMTERQATLFTKSDVMVGIFCA